MYQDDKPNVLFKLVLFLINFYQNLSVKKLSNQNFVWKSFFAIHSNLAPKNFTNHTYFFSRVYTKWTAFSHHIFSRAAAGSLSMPGRSTSFGKKTRIWCIVREQSRAECNLEEARFRHKQPSKTRLKRNVMLTHFMSQSSMWFLSLSRETQPWHDPP